MNRLFLTAITGECCLNYLNGIKFPYNPFVLLKQELEAEGVKLNTRNRAETFNYLKSLYDENQIPYHRLLPVAIERLNRKTTTEEIEKLLLRKDIAEYQRKITTQLSTVIEYNQEIEAIDKRLEQLKHIPTQE